MRDRGGASVEMVLLTPMLMVLVLFIVYAGRGGTVVEQVRHAADQGARSASMVALPRQYSAARDAVLADLRRNGVGCSRPSVQLSLGRRGRVRTVRVTVTCTIMTTGLSLLGSRQRDVRASSTEAIDVFRGGT